MQPLGEAILQKKKPVKKELEERKVLTKGDDEEHANEVLDLVRKTLSSGSTALPVFCTGAWWIYLSHKGVWREISRDEVKLQVLRLSKDYCYLNAKGERTPIAMSTAKVDSIYKMMLIVATDNDFFASAPPGISFRNDTSLMFELKNGSPDVAGHSPMYRLRSYFDFPFESRGKCPKWKEFLRSCFEGDPDAEDKIQFLKEFVGAAIRGHSVRYEKAALLLGSGRNGKSIFCDVISRLFYDGVCCINPQDLNDERKRVPLDGARLNLVSDMSLKGFNDSGGFKQCISGDPLSARRLYAESFMVRPEAAHLYSANDLPRSPDHSSGFYRRWEIINFNRTFNASDSIPRKELLEGLVSELSGICVWALRGSSEVMKRGGFLQPSSSGVTLKQWSAENNVVQQFCLSATTKCSDDQGWTSVHEVYEAYKDWSQHNGHARMASTTFNQRMNKLGYNARRGKDAKQEYELLVKPRQLWASDERAPQLPLRERKPDDLTRN